MTYTVLSHTADTGIEATAETFTDLIGTLATGMFGIMAKVEPCPPQHAVVIEVSAEAAEDLVVDALSELLYRSEVDDLLFCDFEVTRKAETTLAITATGIPVTAVEMTGPPIKAVTYHDVVVRQSDSGWYGRVYFDV